MTNEPLRLTKYAQACVAVDINGTKIVIDPGVFDETLAEIIDDADGLLVTHHHGDHFDLVAVSDALARHPELTVYGPQSVTEQLTAFGARAVTVAPGDTVRIGQVAVRVFGGEHAAVYDDETVTDNVGYLVAGRVYHPGDSFALPDGPVDTLLVPVSGPWMKIGEAAAFISAVRPRVAVAIHDMVNSPMGNDLAGEHLGSESPTATELLQPQPGDSLQL